ncbi:hypothetical protein K9N68_39445 (plasmid) [Kovacikia minuta CCNUW1]|uniref:hypothetical protein n=1 Tax=Kovacikia minuta TaxID=2931930 RepID=UPI001CC9D95F|nr:hypothetical protein [Kovacikia minuta]UBF30205.1 hypothetical protein K9N68_39445 [Kovacikia minuta CCNUW1]
MLKSSAEPTNTSRFAPILDSQFPIWANTRQNRTHRPYRLSAFGIAGSSLLMMVLLMGMVCAGGAIALAIASPIALAQIPSLTLPSGPQTLPSGVERRGTLESTGIRLDGKELFRIASPTVLNRSEPGNQIPVEVRAKQVESNLQRIIDGSLPEGTMLDPETMQVSITNLNGQPVLFVKDSNLVEPKVLLTVTDADAQYHSSSKEILAARWQQVLATELHQALRLRQPEAFKQQISEVVRTLLATALLTLLLGGVWVSLGRRKQQLEQRQMAEMVTVPNEELAPGRIHGDEQQRSFLGLQHYLGLQQRLQIVRFLRLADVLGDRLCLDNWTCLQPECLSSNAPVCQKGNCNPNCDAGDLVFNRANESAHRFINRSLYSKSREGEILNQSKSATNCHNCPCN